MEWLENDGMGVCGYTYREVQTMPIDAISRAIHAKKSWDVENNTILLKMAFGDSSAPSEPVAESARPLTEVFDAIFQ